ncbi:MAG: CopG family transcriptional regulator [bacterium]
MPKLPRRSGLVREPVQVYLAPDDSALLNRLVEESGLSKAEILRRGVKSFAREQSGAVAPMLRFLAESSAGPWPSDVAVDHDAVLAASYRATPKKKPR